MKHPGLLRPQVDPDVIMMICTAGHVDHGKTSLVKLLTGCNTDRLKIEQERGLTIELGFAPCFLGGELCVGVVDVPGHEKFIRNMVAGVSGIEMTVLVIAADDGIMPQTIEHFQIMDLLGVRNGIIALTKIDLVTPERVEQVKADIATFFNGTFLDGAPICPLSSTTGDGVFDFYEILVNRIKGIVARRRRGIFRMPIERVFAQKGFGTVVTGIPVDGVISVGSEVELVPGGQVSKVRGIQRFLRNATEGGCGQCLAINVPDFNKVTPGRGQVISLPGYLRPGRQFYLDLRTVIGLEKPLSNAELVKFHTGTTERNGKIHLLADGELGERSAGIAAIVLSEPVAVAVHDRFILRRPSPAETVAGGEILAIVEDTVRLRRKDLCEQLNEYVSLMRGIDPASPEGVDLDIGWRLHRRCPCGATVRELSVELLWPEATIRESLARQKNMRALGADLFIHDDMYAARLAEMESRFEEAKRENKLNLTLSDVRKGFGDWPAPLWDAVVKEAAEKHKVAVRGDRLLLRGSLDTLPEVDRKLMADIVRLYEETEFNSPRPEELPEMLAATEPRIEKLLRYLCNEGSLVRLAKNVVLSYSAFKKAQDLVVEIVQEKGVIDSADFKYAINSTRKYALAILDYLDGRHVTVRSGNNRKLAPGYEKNLLP